MRNFNEWLSGFRESIADYGYYINFEKVHRNVDNIKVELNILNSLFISFLDSCSKLGNNAFMSEKGQFVISHFEAVFVATTFDAFAKKELITKKIIPESIIALKQDEDFINANQGSVASKANNDALKFINYIKSKFQ